MEDRRRREPPGTKRSLRVRLLDRLSSRRVAWIAALLGFVIALPSLAVGYFIDDRYHEYVLRGHALPGSARGVWDLYRFSDGSPAFAESVREGLYPWWTNPDLKLAFFRPVASLWRYVDFHLFGTSAFVPHVETCLAYAALIFLAARLYGRWVGGSAAGLAAIAFALDDGHGLPVTWIANRYALVATLFGLAAVLAHTRARSSDAPSLLARFASPLLLALALTSGEVSIGVLGYLAGYAWFLDDKGRRAGVLSLAPHGLVTVAWVIAYRAMGYGAAGSSFYVDPLRSPVLFVQKLAVRLPELVVSGVLGPPTEVWTLVPAERGPVIAVIAAVVAGGVVFFVAKTAVGGDPEARRRVAALATGSLLSVLPVCATIPDDRNFLVAGFGFFGILAMAIERVWRREGAGFVARAFAGLLVFVHLVMAPLLFPVRALNMAKTFNGFIQRGAATFPSGDRVKGKTLVIVGAPDSLIVTYMFLERLLDDGPKPDVANVLTVQSQGTFTMTALDDDTVEIANPVGQLHSPFAGLYTDKPFIAGQVFDRDVDRVEVLAVTDTGEPSVIRAKLKNSASDRIWMVWQGKGFVEIPAPVPGEVRTFDGVDVMTAMQPPK